MNTATAQTIEILADVDRLKSPAEDTNPLETRWGIQIAQRDKRLNAYECGTGLVPFGRLFPIASFKAPRENHTIDDTKPKEMMTLVSAAECEAYLMDALGGTGAQNGVNWGLKTFAHSETDSAKMAVINATLLPSLSRIREIAAEMRVEVISDVCEGSDDLDFGVRENCVTCWWKWLTSPAIEQHIENIAMQGMTVKVREPGADEVESKLIRPSVTEFREALAVVLESARIGMKQLQTTWGEIAVEYEKADGIRKDISEFEHGYRKDLHQNKPQDRQFALAREIAKSTAGGNAGNDALVQQLAQITIQNNQLLTQIAAERAGGMKLAPTSEVPTIVDAPAEPVTLTAGDSDIAINGTSATSDLAPAAKKMEEAKKSKR